ncbi:MAG: TraB/GumN family protein [Desulfuromonas sp.]|nr:MAG: TraB/GumN family protein [Desulfuromonas sp.]
MEGVTMFKIFFRSVVVLLLMLLVTSTTFAADKHSIWKADKGASTVYLVGSIHLLNQQSYPLPEIYDRIFSESQNIAFETDLDQIQSPAVQQRLLLAASFKPGNSLQTVLADETYAKLKRYLTAQGLSIENLSGLKPWMLCLTLSIIEMQKLGFSPQFGLDQHFMQKAQRQGKIVLQMESVDEHLATLTGLDRLDQNILVEQTLRDLDKVSTLFGNMVSAWRHGDAEQLDRLINGSMRAEPQLKELLLDRRNRKWCAKVESLLELKQTAMVVVGAAHLAGKGSVVELLRQKGYRVEQL